MALNLASDYLLNSYKTNNYELNFTFIDGLIFYLQKIIDSLGEKIYLCVNV